MNRLIGLSFVSVLAAAPAANILKNPGFEDGLFCYSNWVWSATGKDFAGDFAFALSSDAHSGKRSLEMSCTGPDCKRASVFTHAIPTPPSQSYRLRVWAKCPRGTAARTNAVLTLEDSPGVNLQCTGKWEENELSFKVGPGAPPFKLYFTIEDGVKDGDWLRIDDIVLTYSNGKVPPAVLAKHAGVRDVTVSETHINVDGKPFIPLGFFGVPDSDLEMAAKTGANTIHELGPESSMGCFQTALPDNRDTAFDLGLNVIRDLSFTTRLLDASVFPAAITKYAPHRSQIAWMLSDEPDQSAVRWWYVPADSFNNASKALRQSSR